MRVSAYVRVCVCLCMLPHTFTRCKMLRLFIIVSLHYLTLPVYYSALLRMLLHASLKCVVIVGRINALSAV